MRFAVFKNKHLTHLTWDAGNGDSTYLMERTRAVSPRHAVSDAISLHRQKDAPHRSALLYLLANLQSPKTVATIATAQQPSSRPSIFSTLPPELILLILESVSSFIEVANLIRTAQIFRHVWQLNAAQISYKFFPQAIDCFPEAEQLVDVQEEAASQQQQQQQQSQQQHQQEHHQTALRRTKLILSNAHHVSLVSDLFETKLIPEIVLNRYLKRDHPCHYLTSTERTRFTHTYYRLWIFTTIGDIRHSPGLRFSFLARLNNKELYCMREVGVWLACCVDSEELLRLGFLKSGEEDMKGKGWYLAWVEVCREWSKREEDLPDNASGLNIPRYAPSNVFAMFDMWQEWLQPDYFVGPTMWSNDRCQSIALRAPQPQ